MNVAQETLDFRCGTFPVPLSLLMPTSAFLYTPTCITAHLQPEGPALTAVAYRMLPYHFRLAAEIHSFGTKFKSRELSALSRLTSELLRTLSRNGCF